VSFSQAVFDGTATVEGVTAEFASSVEDAEEIVVSGGVPVLVDPGAFCLVLLRPDVVVDAILAKRNLGTAVTDAPVVIGVGPGFMAGADCHAVVETQRGHDLGRVIRQGEALLNTGVPGEIGGHSQKRVLRAPCRGVFRQMLPIGSLVRPGDVVGMVDDVLVRTEIKGTLRGVLATGVLVRRGMKCGDVDPRCEERYCYTASDKARAIGGGVLEAILALTPDVLR